MNIINLTDFILQYGKDVKKGTTACFVYGKGIKVTGKLAEVYNYCIHCYKL